MRPLNILVLSSLYPPYFVGGYELGCADVVAGLRERGHEVTVLTGMYGVDHSQQDGFVYRFLNVDVWSTPQSSLVQQWRNFQRELHNQRIALRVARDLQPDLIYVWSIHHASLSIVRLLQQAGYKTAFFISDLWPKNLLDGESFYRIPRHPIRHIYRRLLGKYLTYKTGFRENLSLKLEHAQFASRFLFDTIQTVTVVTAPSIIHWGVDVQRFYVERTPAPLQRRLLYVGQIADHKGMDMLLKMLALLHTIHGLTDVTLSIVGGAFSETYLAGLQKIAYQLGIHHAIEWVGKLSRDLLPAIYAQYDIFIFPSRWEEPFSITVVEALAAGLVVIATATGGTPEIIHHKQTGLLFDRDDAEQCASLVSEVLSNAELAYTLRTHAQHMVQTSYQMNLMVEKVEKALAAVVSIQEPCE